MEDPICQVPSLHWRPSSICTLKPFGVEGQTACDSATLDIGDFHKWGYPQMVVCPINPIKMDDKPVPPFMEPPIDGWVICISWLTIDIFWINDLQ